MFLYRPFKNDLYSAEVEWNGDGLSNNLKAGPRLSWDAIRPSLYRCHSGINKVLTISEEGIEMSGDDKMLEEINTMISQKRESRTVVPKEPVKKLEILHKHAVEKQNSFYITKKDDDFYYKGRVLSLSGIETLSTTKPLFENGTSSNLKGSNRDRLHIPLLPKLF